VDTDSDTDDFQHDTALIKFSWKY